jgi:hypothetical protein
MCFSFYKTTGGVEDNRSAQQDSGTHCKKLSMIAVSPIDKIRNKADYKQHTAGQRAQKSYAYPNLPGTGTVFFQMQMIMNHIRPLKIHSPKLRQAPKIP